MVMKKPNCGLLLVGLIASFGSTRATTVIPPTFEQLVEQAELIFQGSVTDMRSSWVGEGAQRHIVSYISFKVEDAIKGSPGGSFTICLLGGTGGGETMGVTG